MLWPRWATAANSGNLLHPTLCFSVAQSHCCAFPLREIQEQWSSADDGIKAKGYGEPRSWYNITSYLVSTSPQLPDLPTPPPKRPTMTSPYSVEHLASSVSTNTRLQARAHSLMFICHPDNVEVWLVPTNEWIIYTPQKYWSVHRFLSSHGLVLIWLSLIIPSQCYT
jgi:hypothetical protein